MTNVVTTLFEIPVTPAQSQTFEINLSGVVYTFLLQWNYIANCWVLDIQDDQQNPLAQGLPLVTGLSLLTQLAYLGIGEGQGAYGGGLYVQSDNDYTLVPSFETLGDTGHLFYGY